MARDEQARPKRTRAAAKKASTKRASPKTAAGNRKVSPKKASTKRALPKTAAGNRKVKKPRSESGAVRRPRGGGGAGETPPEKKVSKEGAGAETPELRPVETRGVKQVQEPEEAPAALAEAAQPPSAEKPPTSGAPSPLPPGEGQGEGAVPPAAVTPVPPERRAEAERVVRELLEHMGLAARLELKDAPDGGLAMAVHFEGEPPAGVQAGRRSPVMDSLQFIANKLFNKPGMERRWLSLAAFAFPEPRVPGGRKPAPAPAAAPGQAPAAAARTPAAPTAAPPTAAQPPARPPRAEAPARLAEGDERTLEVAEDAALAQEARTLAERASRLGRFFAVLGMSTEDRARVLRAAGGTAGVRVHAEGEGRHRRVVFSPDKPAPLPKRNLLPDWDDEDEDV